MSFQSWKTLITKNRRKRFVGNNCAASTRACFHGRKAVRSVLLLVCISIIILCCVQLAESRARCGCCAGVLCCLSFEGSALEVQLVGLRTICKSDVNKDRCVASFGSYHTIWMDPAAQLALAAAVCTSTSSSTPSPPHLVSWPSCKFCASTV